MPRNLYKRFLRFLTFLDRRIGESNSNEDSLIDSLVEDLEEDYADNSNGAKEFIRGHRKVMRTRKDDGYRDMGKRREAAYEDFDKAEKSLQPYSNFPESLFKVFRAQYGGVKTLTDYFLEEALEDENEKTRDSVGHTNTKIFTP